MSVDKNDYLKDCCRLVRKQDVPSRPFAPPWSVEEESACFVVRDHNGQARANVYFEDESARRSAAQPRL
jgi:hypothetical protein